MAGLAHQDHKLVEPEPVAGLVAAAAAQGRMELAQAQVDLELLDKGLLVERLAHPLVQIRELAAAAVGHLLLAAMLLGTPEETAETVQHQAFRGCL